jgi:hypothetical protein
MAWSGPFGLAPAGLPDIDRPTQPAIGNGGTSLGAINDPGRNNGGVPRPAKRWRLFVMSGAASAFFRESPPDQRAPNAPGSRRRRSSEFAARPAQPARSSTQARS